MNEDWDATASACLSNQGLATLIWIVCRVRPDFKITEMRVDTYEQLYTRFKIAAERRDRNCPQEFKQVRAAMESLSLPWQDDDIMGVAAHFGFKELLPKRGVSIGRGRRRR